MTMETIEIDGEVYEELDVQIQQQRREAAGSTGTLAPVDNDFARRMANWRKVVQTWPRENAVCCAAWAKMYIQQRLMAEQEQGAVDLEIGAVPAHIPVDVLDGWLVEAAWRTLGDYDQREALRSAHVLLLPDEIIRRRLRGVRGRHVRLFLAK